MDGYDQTQLSTQQREVIARIMAEVPDPTSVTQDSVALSERRDQLALEDEGTWLVVTSSGTEYLFRLDGAVRTVVRLIANEANAHSGERTVMHRDGEVLPLLGLIEPPGTSGCPYLPGQASQHHACRAHPLARLTSLPWEVWATRGPRRRTDLGARMRQAGGPT